MPEETQIPIRSDSDIVTARQKGRALAAKLGFSASDAALIATAISELTRNIVSYAKQGEILLKSLTRGSSHGILVIARDEGPGIANVPEAMKDGYSTSGSLGLGLPGVKRLADEFEIVTQVGKGTTVTFKKWNA